MNESTANCDLEKDKRLLVANINDIFASLEQNPRVEKLPSALFDRLLSALFEINSEGVVSAITSINYDCRHFYDDSHSSCDHRYFVRLLIRFFASSQSLLENKSAVQFFLQCPTTFEHDSVIISTWLQACSLMVLRSEMHAWVYSNGCVIKILSFVKHSNIYVSRNAAAAIFSLLKFCSIKLDSANTERIGDILTLMLANVLQLDPSGAVFRSPGLNSTGHQSVPEHCAVESARVIVEFCDSLYLSKLDPSAIRAALNICLSKEEAEAIIRIALRVKRLLDNCIAIYCSFADDTFDSDILSGEALSRVALRRVKIAGLLKNYSSVLPDQWQLILKPIMNISSVSNSSYVNLVTDFLEKCDIREVNTGLILQACYHLSGYIKSGQVPECLAANCLKFVTAGLKISTSNFNRDVKSIIITLLEICKFLISTEDKPIGNRLIIDLLRSIASILSWIQREQNSSISSIVSDFITLCNDIETYNVNDVSAAIRFASAESLLNLITSSGSSMIDDEAILNELKKWSLSAAKTLSKCASSNFNFEDVISAYGHSSRFNLLSQVIQSKKIITDTDFVAELFTFLPVDKLNRMMSLAFPATRRSAVVFVFVIAHVYSHHHSTGDQMLSDLMAVPSDEPDDFVAKILKCWSEKCDRHLDPDCTLMKDNCHQNCFPSFEKPAVALTEQEMNLNTIRKASRICKDVLTFLHSPDDTPCVVIGSGDGNEEMSLDCEES